MPARRSREECVQRCLVQKSKRERFTHGVARDVAQGTKRLAVGVQNQLLCTSKREVKGIEVLAVKKKVKSSENIYLA